ncbi:hypothetical protein L6452_36061 [Arctium lappa]|uniref:Uncharacterized protein n=1 Tax=Arctium lappa TaxID=4217 RepID=A0ACB8Y917_ARCLA|nr:hypothetical protein L6452_36061 [Arctium lappa]
MDSVRGDSETPPRKSPRGGEIGLGFKMPTLVVAVVVGLGVADLATTNKDLQSLKTLAADAIGVDDSSCVCWRRK